MSEILKVGLIGVGGMGRMHYNGYASLPNAAAREAKP